MGEITAIGSISGAGFAKFASWAFQYGQQHARYLVWRVLEDGSEETTIASEQCFDFVIHGLRLLKGQGGTNLNITELTRTIVNVYTSTVETLALNESINDFFKSERRVLEEWVELTGEFPHLFKRSTEWYWPAWFDKTPYAGGSGKLVEDTDYPQTYHRYVLAWPKKTRSTATAPGVQRLSVPIFNQSSSAILV